MGNVSVGLAIRILGLDKEQCDYGVGVRRWQVELYCQPGVRDFSGLRT